MSDVLKVEHDKHVTWLTLNRPERLNALNDELMQSIALELDNSRQTDARVVVIRGEGRGFCSGYDISPDAEEVDGAATRGPVEDRDRLLGNIDLFTKIWRHPQPVITAVHGVCVAAGTQLASLSDMTIVADDAKIMASPALPLGGGYLSPLWVHRVGSQRAKLMSFDAARSISGKESAEWGWSALSFPQEDLMHEVRRIAHSMARTPGDLLRLKKEAINRTIEPSGLLSYARTGAETDALLHLTPEVKNTHDRIKELGLKGAIKEFNADFLAEFPGGSA